MNTVDKLNAIDPHGTHPNRDKNIIFKPHELAPKIGHVPDCDRQPPR